MYGEPELVYAFSSICVENGAVPVVIASGTRSNRLAGMVTTLLADADEQPVILEETNFAAILGRDGCSSTLSEPGTVVVYQR